MNKNIIFVSIILIFTSCLKSTDSYEDLPSFTFDGHLYKVAPDPHSEASDFISWTTAYSYCENLTAYGFSDWRMPTVQELETMYINRGTIGGFIEETTEYGSCYHSSTDSYYYDQYNHWCTYDGFHFLINWQDGSRTSDSDIEESGHWDSWHAHVRPIRIDR